MRTTRLLAAATAAALLAAPFAGTAGAAEQGRNGAGTGTVSASLLEVSLGGGDVLSVRLLGSDTTSTNDGAGSAAAALVPAAVSSGVASALNVSTPTVSTSSTGAKDERSQQVAVPALPGFAGSLNAALSSLVDEAGAHATLAAGAANVSLAGGLVRLPQGLLEIATDAVGDRSVASHTLSIPSATVLDLSALLEGLGLSLPDLSVETLLDLVERLGLNLRGVADPAALVEDLNETIEVLEGATGTVTAELCGTIDGLLGGDLGDVGGIVDDVVGGLPGTIGDTVGDVTGSLPDLGGGVGGLGDGLLGAQLLDGVSCTDLIGTSVTDVLKEVETTLGTLLGGIAQALDGVALLSVRDVEIGLASTATDKVETSTADVTASIGSVRVGAVPVPGVADLELTAPAAIVNQAAAAIQAQLDSVLGAINSQLRGIVDVDVLDIEELVGAGEGGAVEAVSRVTALRATITPPTGLLAAAVDLEGTLASVLGDLGTALPALSPVMGQLEAALGGLDALTDTTVLTVGTVSANAAFRPVAAQVTPGSGPGSGSGTGTGTGGRLPRTGADAALPAMAAVALGGAGLAIRRLLRHATT